MKAPVVVALLGWFLWATTCANLSARAADQDAPPLPRIEARSPSFLVVGVVQGDTMTLHVSRLVDNSPVHDAQLGVLLRGETHATAVQPDGSYTFSAEDLKLPGTASVQFTVTQSAEQAQGAGPTQAAIQEKMTGTLQIGAQSAKEEGQNSARQLAWWVLNFAVCIGFLVLISRRRKSAPPES